MDLGLNGRRAIVTGGAPASAGRSRSSSPAKASTSVIASRTLAELERTADELRRSTGGDVVAVVADVANDDDVGRLVERTVELFGGVDILVNNAAVMGESARSPSVLDVPIGVATTEYDNKPLAYLRCIQAAAPHMIAGGWGRIINIAGLSARTTGNASSSMRQAAISALTKNAADELGPLGINVTTLHPGATRTDRLDGILAAASADERAVLERRLAASSVLGRVIEADEVASVVTFLRAPRSVALNGDSIAVNGGTPGVIAY